MCFGFVYVLTNDAMPGLVKIGKTKRHPTERSNDLYTTGVATPFQVEFAIFSSDMDTLEKNVHEELADCRVATSREFFRIGCDEAVLCIVNTFLTDFDYVAEHAGFVIDPGDFSRYTSICGVCPPDLLLVIDQFSSSEWKFAAARLFERRENIERRRKDG